jgi:hypothetical protein
MKHLVANLQNRRFGYIEQACERYATMVYEVLRRELAIGFRSVKTSYTGSPEDQHVGTFTATMIPWQQTDKYRHGDRSTKVSFTVCADSEEDFWYLSQGKVVDIESGMQMTIQFSQDGRRIAITIPEWDEIRFASNADHVGDKSVFSISAGQKPWENLVDCITV